MAECICKASGLGECIYDSDTYKATYRGRKEAAGMYTDECDDASCSACVPQTPSTPDDADGLYNVIRFDPIRGALIRTREALPDNNPKPTNTPEQPKADSAQAADILTKSAGLLEERGKRYDKADGTSSMDRAVAALNTITGHNLTEADGWLLMLMLKLSRATAKAEYHADSYEDAAAFVGLMAVARRKQAEEEGK